MSLFLGKEHGLTVNFGLSSNHDINYIQDEKPETFLGFSKPPSPPLYTQMPLYECQACGEGTGVWLGQATQRG